MAKKIKQNKRKNLLQQQINLNAGGIDIGAEELMCAVSPEATENFVRSFDSFTCDLKEMVAWFRKHKVATVAMESTGVYWIAAYDLLEEAGIEVCLVNARHVKGVPGKKTDVCDAQWLQQLHQSGLLKGSFRPKAEVLHVRHIVRHRSRLVEENTRHLQHMQKALVEMNMKLHHVFSDIDGKSCMSMIEAILKGERNVDKLWELKTGAVKATKQLFLKAMEGTWDEVQLFILQQAYDDWKHTWKQIRQCDHKIEKLLQEINLETNEDLPERLPKHRAKTKNQLNFDVYQQAYKAYGVDLSTIDGVGAGLLTVLMSEIGSGKDLLENFTTSKKFCSWLAVCPNNKISGGKILSSKTKNVVNRVAQALRLSAHGVHHSNSELGQYCRRMKGRLGKVEGITATAHKIARLIYALIESKEPYDEAKAFAPNEKSTTKKIKLMKKLAESLNYQVLPV